MALLQLWLSSKAAEQAPLYKSGDAWTLAAYAPLDFRTTTSPAASCFVRLTRALALLL
jgi:hypothetical protein